MSTQTPSGAEVATRTTSPITPWPQGFADLRSDWPVLDLLRSWSNQPAASGRIKVEEFVDGDHLVVRAENGVLEIGLPQPVAPHWTKSIPVSRG